MEETENTSVDGEATAPEMQLSATKEIASWLDPLNKIKVESVLSRYPIHNLTKQEAVAIFIQRSAANGEVEFHWEVSPNAKFGQPRPTAYRVDCLIVNRRIDESPRPLPSLIRLGSLRQMCQELGITDSGKNKNDLKIALQQNAGAMISAKLKYKGKDGTEHKFEHYFNRYNVVFTGDRLGDGRIADAVYLYLSEPYRQLLNNVPFRPLDYEYLKQLTPMAQRFYELLSFRIYRAIKSGEAQAKLLYSEYCLAAPQERKFTQRDVKRQMVKIHDQHLQAGYISDVEIQPFFDDSGQADFWLLYTLGPKAHAEYQAFNTPQPAAQKRGLMGQGSLNPDLAIPVAPNAALTPSGATVSGKVAGKETGKDLLQEAAQLVKAFHGGLGVEPPAPPRRKELEQARELIRQHGFETAHFIVNFGLAEARRTKFEMRYFGALLSYESAALQRFNASQAESATPSGEALERAAAEARWQQLSPLERLERETRANQLLEECNITARADWQESQRSRWVEEFALAELLEELRAGR